MFQMNNLHINIITTFHDCNVLKVADFASQPVSNFQLNDDMFLELQTLWKRKEDLEGSTV